MGANHKHTKSKLSDKSDKVDLSFLEEDDDQQSIKQKVSELFESRGELDPLVRLGIENTDILLSKGRLASALRHLSRALGIASVNPKNDAWEGYNPGTDYVASYHPGRPTFDEWGALVDFDDSVTPRIIMPTEELQEKIADEGMEMVDVLRHELMHSGLQALANAQNLAPNFVDGIPIRSDISQIAGMLPGFDPNPHWDTFLSDYKRDIREDFSPVYLGDDAPPLDGNFDWTWLASENDWSKTNPYTFLDPNEVVDFDHDLLYSVMPREQFSPPDELQDRFSRDYENILGLIGKLAL